MYEIYEIYIKCAQQTQVKNIEILRGPVNYNHPISHRPSQQWLEEFPAVVEQSLKVHCTISGKLK